MHYSIESIKELDATMVTSPIGLWSAVFKLFATCKRKLPYLEYQGVM